MSKPDKKTLKLRQMELRKLIEDPTTDNVTSAIAYAMEYAIIWATQETVSWPRPAKEAGLQAENLRRELAVKSGRQ